MSAASVAGSCALFGVVYRYALRSDLGNPHLRGGAFAAFGLTRHLGEDVEDVRGDSVLYVRHSDCPFRC